MRFFTDKTVVNDYLMIKIKDYLKLKDYSKWKEIFVDPGVYDLTKSNKFAWEGKINIDDFLDFLPGNHFFSFDYPCDMNEKFTDLFLRKTWDRAKQYHTHPQYIVTVQNRFLDYWDFGSWFDLYNELNIASGIMGLGNLCRLTHLTPFLKGILYYAFSHCNHPRIHVYGLCLRAIPYAEELARIFNIKLSTDSTKWTFVFYEQDSKDRQVQFDIYKNKIKSKGIILE